VYLELACALHSLESDFVFLEENLQAVLHAKADEIMRISFYN
jgi:hypothetical protein